MIYFLRIILLKLCYMGICKNKGLNKKKISNPTQTVYFSSPGVQRSARLCYRLKKSPKCTYTKYNSDKNNFQFNLHYVFELPCPIYVHFMIGQFLIAQLADFQTAGVTNEKAVTNAIQPDLNILSRQATKVLTSCLERGRRLFDNQMIYAKLFYWAMVRDMFTFSNTQAVATANAVGGNPEWVN